MPFEPVSPSAAMSKIRIAMPPGKLGRCERVEDFPDPSGRLCVMLDRFIPVERMIRPEMVARSRYTSYCAEKRCPRTIGCQLRMGGQGDVQ